jgi:hypothetical protein
VLPKIRRLLRAPPLPKGSPVLAVQVDSRGGPWSHQAPNPIGTRMPNHSYGRVHL